MKNIKVFSLALFFAVFVFSEAPTGTIDLFDWGFNVNGDLYLPGDPLPEYFDESSFDFDTGLGEITIDWDPGVGDHSLVAFFDHEIDSIINGYTNESGSVISIPNPGQSWEIDEPGFFFGDIYDNFLDGTLDNTNAVPAGSEDDVSMAMGWNFSLAADETAVINFLLGEELPAGFSVWHSDIESLTSIFFSSTLEIQSDAGPAPIPEPATIGLVSIGLFGILCFRRRIKK